MKLNGSGFAVQNEYGPTSSRCPVTVTSDEVTSFLRAAAHVFAWRFSHYSARQDDWEPRHFGPVPYKVRSVSRSWCGCECATEGDVSQRKKRAVSQLCTRPDVKAYIDESLAEIRNQLRPQKIERLNYFTIFSMLHH